MAKKKIAQEPRPPKRAEPFRDATKAPLMKGDVKYVISQLQLAFEEVFDADTFPAGGERDACVLRALRRLRSAQSTLASGMTICDVRANDH
jgi:hypothetical protein